MPPERFGYSDKVETEGPMISDVYFEKLTLVNNMGVRFNCAFGGGSLVRWLLSK